MAQPEHTHHDEPEFDEENFTPTGAWTLTLAYLGVFFLAWGSVYVLELLARR